MTRLRFHWWDPSADDDAITPWVYPALIIATLFLNAAFWYGEGPEFPLRGPALWCFMELLGEAILLCALFYLGPALATQGSKHSLLELAETSLGSIGAFGLRVFCAVFLVLWLGEQFNLIVRWFLPLWTGSQASAIVEGATACALVLLLFWTGLQNVRVTAKLAFFTNKLGVALLIAALIRVKAGWPTALQALEQQSRLVQAHHFWRGLAQLSFWAAPLLFLASGFGQRCQSGRQVRWIGLFGIVLPVAAVLIVLGFIERAAHGAGASTQGIANIGSALFHGDSARYYWKFLAVIAITMFGTVRYGVMALAECLTIFRTHRFVYWALLGFAAFASTVLASTLFLDLSNIIALPARCLVAAAAVLSADSLTGRWRVASRKIDWIGVTALLAGMGLPYLSVLFFDTGPTLWDPWLLSYAASFSICLLVRMARFGYDRIGDLCATSTRTT